MTSVRLLIFLPLCLCLNQDDPYEIPNPEILVYNDGFSLSIPDEAGIEMLFFYGSVNRVTAFLEPDTITIATRDKIRNKWILRYNQTQPQVGEFIHYWLYVKKNGRDYRRNAEFYYVEDIIPQSVDNQGVTQSSTTKPDFPYEIETPLPTPFPTPPFPKTDVTTSKNELSTGTVAPFQEPVWDTIAESSTNGFKFSTNFINEPLPLGLNPEGPKASPGPKIPSVVMRECEVFSKIPLEKKVQKGLVFETLLSENPTPCPGITTEVPGSPVQVLDLSGSSEMSVVKQVKPRPNVLSLLSGSAAFVLHESKSHNASRREKNNNEWTWNV